MGFWYCWATLYPKVVQNYWPGDGLHIALRVRMRENIMMKNAIIP